MRFWGTFYTFKKWIKDRVRFLLDVLMKYVTSVLFFLTFVICLPISESKYTIGYCYVVGISTNRRHFYTLAVQRKKK